jgi:Flp pilus assembly protein TadG
MIRDRKGGVALLAAFTLVPLIGFTGLAIDGARAWLVSSRLNTALDAAALAGARNINLAPAQRDAEIAGMFWANFGTGSTIRPDPLTPGHRLGLLGASAPAGLTTIERLDANTIRIATSAALPTTFMRIFGFQTLTVSADARARRADLGMEVALVLDVTGSMGRNYAPGARNDTDFDTGQNIHALRLAARDLVDILYGADANGVPRETVPNLWVSVVPYTTTVNVGPQRADWVDFNAIAPSTTDGRTTFGAAGLAAYGPAHPTRPNPWAGCIEARHLDANAAAYQRPVSPTDRFRPFFWASTLRNDRTPRQDAQGRPIPGDNDWVPVVATTEARPAPLPADYEYRITEQWRSARENFAAGPNIGCPPDEVLPLTAARSAVIERVSGLRSTNRGGTMANIGLQFGWFTLSPLWRSAWNIAGGAVPPGQDTALPLNYGAPFMRKVVVLMTDGQNTWFDFPQGAPGLCNDTSLGDTPGSNLRTLPSVPAGLRNNAPVFRLHPCPPGFANDGSADYTGYGRLSEGRLGTTSNATANTTLNTRMLELCTFIKDSGVTIYTVTFALTNTATQDLFRSCASAPENYFNSPTREDLRAAFQTIGSQLANLRLMP